MSDYDFSGLNDFQIETANTTFGKLVMGVMLLVFFMASAITTFSFFVTYAPRLGEVLHPAYGPYIAGALGVILFDLAGLGWTVLRARNSDTTRQFVIATGAAIVTIILALLVSGLQVMLSSSFDVGLYDMTRTAVLDPATGAAMLDAAGLPMFEEVATLSDFGQNMQLIGVVVMTLGFVLNFAAIAAYVNVSKDVTKAVQNTQLQAYITAGRFAADRTRAELVTRQTLGGILKQLPDYASRAGEENTAGYVNRAFAGLPSGQKSPSPSPDNQDDIDAKIEAAIQRALAQSSGNGNGRNADPEFSLVDWAEQTSYGNGNGNGANFTQRPTNGRGL